MPLFPSLQDIVVVIWAFLLNGRSESVVEMLFKRRIRKEKLRSWCLFARLSTQKATRGARSPSHLVSRIPSFNLKSATWGEGPLIGACGCDGQEVNQVEVCLRR
jgi:hypothetical protein